MDLFELSAKLKLDSSSFERGIGKAEKSGKGLANSLSDNINKVQSLAKKVIAGYALKKLSDALIKPAVKAYADYEQLVGGVETLFGKAAVFVQQDASKAFEQAGISANKYMETATSFAASLMQGLKGDSLQAAEYANRAIIDMSDNANKMGTSIDAIQNAYKGFSKQNFTMLDNLKLGYGGTKQEMQRLLKDAEKLTGQKYDISNFADIVDAIHAIQVEMGVAGTTSKEAATTVTGSWNATKAAWQDLLVAMGDPKGNIKKAVKNLVTMGKTTAKNVLPVITQAVSGIGDLISEIAPMIGDALPELVGDFLPKFIDAGINIASGLGKGIINAVKKIKWPSWDQVKVGASKAWDLIKQGVSGLGGLIFGRNEDGSVNWPKWTTKLAEAGRNALGEIQKGIDSLGGFVFGYKQGEGGTPVVDWPDGEKIAKAVGDWWDGVKSYASDAIDFIMDAPSAPNATGQVIHDLIAEWWKGVKSFAESALSFLFGSPEPGDPAGLITREKIVDWWNKRVKSFLGGVLDFTLGLFGLPSAEEMRNKIVNWWNNDVVGGVTQLIRNIVPVDTFNALVDQSLDDALKRIDGKENTALRLLDDLIKMGDASKLTAEQQALWKSNAEALIGIFPQLSEVINTDTLTISGNTSEIRENIKEWANMSRQRAIQDARTKKQQRMAEVNNDLIEKQIQLEEKRADLDAARKRQGQEANEVLRRYGFDQRIDTNTSAKEQQRQYNDILHELSETLGQSDEYEKFWQEFGAAGNIGKTITEIDALNQQIENTKSQLQTAIDEYQKWETAVDSFLKGVDTSTETEAGKAEEAIGKVGKAIAAVAGSYDIYLNVHTNNGPYIELPYGGDASEGLDLSMFGKHHDAKGDWNIPYDNYPALLHRNEMVLTASQARQYREGGGTNINGLLSAIQGMRNDLQNLKFQVDGKDFGRAVVDYGSGGVKKNINNTTRAAQAGYGA